MSCPLYTVAVRPRNATHRLFFDGIADWATLLLVDSGFFPSPRDGLAPKDGLLPNQKFESFKNITIAWVKK